MTVPGAVVSGELTGAVLLVGGVASMTVGFLALRQARTFVRRAQRAIGHVVDLYSYVGHQSAGTAPVVEFETADGRTIRFASRAGSNPSMYKRGDSVGVLYDPARPEAAKVDSFLALWLGPTIFIGVGSALALFSSVGFSMG